MCHMLTSWVASVLMTHRHSFVLRVWMQGSHGFSWPSVHGLSESVLTQVESGACAVSDELLEAVLRAAGYRPSLPLAMQADKILACAESHGLSNLRVFGSSVRGEDDFDSDIDLLVTPSTSTDLFDLALFVDDVERLTGFPADVVSDSPLPVQLAGAAREAVPL